MDWTNEIQDIKNALTEVGFDVALVRAGTKTGPAFAPTFAAPTEQTVRVIQSDLTVFDEKTTSLRVVGKTFFFAPVSPAPVPGDRIRIGASYYTLSMCKDIAPGGTVLAHKVKVST